jgi:hypothetical protein
MGMGYNDYQEHKLLAPEQAMPKEKVRLGGACG